ncbi:MAG: cation diffusion facilitator CzcD-associated flavoprotein CzcO [Bacteroidia bacterium]|jgi:cation diffusion facilitator CzcD-associated flavoprotein CzcO
MSDDKLHGSASAAVLDVIIVGAGFAGIDAPSS